MSTNSEREDNLANPLIKCENDLSCKQKRILNKRKISVVLPHSYDVNQVPLKGDYGYPFDDDDITAMSVLSLYQSSSFDNDMDTSKLVN